jgi:hypothetical protein
MSVSRSVEWGALLGMKKVETVEQMPEEYRQTLLKIIYALASTEFASVEQHHPWINKGPTPEDRYLQCQIAADEAHQGFSDCRLLRSLGPEGAGMVDDLLRRRMGEHLLVLKPKAVSALRHLCLQAGELLPLACNDAELVAWNVTTIVDARDEEKSNVLRFPGGRMMARVDATTRTPITRLRERATTGWAYQGHP